MSSNAIQGDSQKGDDKFDQADYTTTPDNCGAMIPPGGEHDEGQEKGISTGPNARPLNDTIAQAAPGVPDDSSRPVEISPEEEEAIAANILKHGRAE
jgi:hypothetical protein